LGASTGIAMVRTRKRDRYKEEHARPSPQARHRPPPRLNYSASWNEPTNAERLSGLLHLVFRPSPLKLCDRAKAGMA
jgi:hypothetical protein